MQAHDDKNNERSEFLDALKKGILLGAALLVIIIPSIRKAQQPPTAPPPAAVATAPSVVQPAPVPAPLPAPRPAPQLADFRDAKPPPEVRHVANWAHYSGDHKRMAFVVIDKKNARVWVFGPDGKLKENAPALLGSAVGDHTVPGVGDKPLSQVKPEEKTTPAGRFIAEPGMNTNGEDIVWVDYDAAVSMHRVRPNVKAERRLERLASPTTADNRISFGCINLPVAFYDGVLSPTVKRHGAVVYVLPEVSTPQEVFGSYDVPAGGKQQLAMRSS